MVPEKGSLTEKPKLPSSLPYNKRVSSVQLICFDVGAVAVTFSARLTAS
jgi:hypothetical protein